MKFTLIATLALANMIPVEAIKLVSHQDLPTTATNPEERITEMSTNESLDENLRKLLIEI